MPPEEKKKKKKSNLKNENIQQGSILLWMIMKIKTDNATDE